MWIFVVLLLGWMNGKYKVLGEQLFQQTGLRMLCGESVLPDYDQEFGSHTYKYNMANLLKYTLFSVWTMVVFILYEVLSS